MGFHPRRTQKPAAHHPRSTLVGNVIVDVARIVNPPHHSGQIFQGNVTLFTPMTGPVVPKTSPAVRKRVHQMKTLVLANDFLWRVAAVTALVAAITALAALAAALTSTLFSFLHHNVTLRDRARNFLPSVPIRVVVRVVVDPSEVEWEVFVGVH